MKNAIGLDSQKAEKLAQGLNELLADYSLFYMNVRGLHWNIKGDKFFELHLKFEELYNDLILKIDEVAERILTLGNTPLHTFDSYKDASQLEVVSNVSDGKAGVGHVLEAFATILVKQRQLLALATEANDEGTTALMSDYIRQQEKLVWMYSSFLGS